MASPPCQMSDAGIMEYDTPKSPSSFKRDSSVYKLGPVKGNFVDPDQPDEEGDDEDDDEDGEEDDDDEENGPCIA